MAPATNLLHVITWFVDKPFTDAYICITRSQWVKNWSRHKMAAFCRPHFQIDFVEAKCILIQISLKLVPKRTINFPWNAQDIYPWYEKISILIWATKFIITSTSSRGQWVNEMAPGPSAPPGADWQVTSDMLPIIWCHCDVTPTWSKGKCVAYGMVFGAHTPVASLTNMVEL